MNIILHNGHELVTCRNKNTAKILNHVSILYATLTLPSCLYILFRSNQTLIFPFMRILRVLQPMFTYTQNQLHENKYNFQRLNTNIHSQLICCMYSILDFCHAIFNAKKPLTICRKPPRNAWLI